MLRKTIRINLVLLLGLGLPLSAQEVPPCFQSKFFDVPTILEGGFGSVLSISGDRLAIPATDLVTQDDLGIILFEYEASSSQWIKTTTFSQSQFPGGTGPVKFSLSGDRILIGRTSTQVGSITQAGSALVYRLDPGLGTWDLDNALSASNPEQGADFGKAVAIGPNLLLIGSPSKDQDGCQDIPLECRDFGAAYVFTYDGANWVEEAILLASDGESFDLLGESVALVGDVAIVSARGDDDAGLNAGAVYVFKRNGGLWPQVAKITASNGNPGDSFSLPLVFDGVTLAVGSHDHDYGGSDKGAVYLYTDDGTSDWLFKQKLTPPFHPDGLNGGFGWSLGIDGDRLAIGSHDLSNHGAAHAYRLMDGAWDHWKRYVALDGPILGDDFGQTVAIHGDSLLVGAPGDDEEEFDAGALYIHELAFQSDCNVNCIEDGEDIANGTGFDCNADGVMDECEILDGSAIDCNNNLVPDDCEDCNNNGQADECELAGQLVIDTPQFGPIGLGSSPTHTFITPRTAFTDVTLDLTSYADLQGSFKYIEVYLNDDFQGRVFNGSGTTGCPFIPEVDQLVIPMADYNALVGSGDATFRFVGEGFLADTCVDPSWVQFTMSYTGPPTTPDVNVNGVPDSCDLARGDNNLDGVVNVDDLLNLLAKWGACGSPRPEDTDLDGDVDVEDLLSLLSGWG
ncbi:MAG: hypothetical protein O7G85_13925 [Planctomycetota bacterium]|nr:hypothetical protein [Planctomycetota bacterium]